MKLELTDSNFVIKLEWYEQIFAVRVNPNITIPLSHIITITNEFSNIQNYALRVQGTYIPCFLKAGIFYTSMGREFWYIKRNITNYLVLTLQEEKFVRLVLTVQDAQEWIQRIAIAVNRLT